MIDLSQDEGRRVFVVGLVVVFLEIGEEKTGRGVLIVLIFLTFEIDERRSVLVRVTLDELAIRLTDIFG